MSIKNTETIAERDSFISAQGMNDQQLIRKITDALENAVKSWLDEHGAEILNRALRLTEKFERPIQPPAPPGNPKIETTYLTPTQLASRWNMHPESVRQFLRKRRLTTVRIGRRVLVSRKTIEDYEVNGTLRSIQ